VNVATAMVLSEIESIYVVDLNLYGNPFMSL